MIFIPLIPQASLLLIERADLNLAPKLSWKVTHLAFGRHRQVGTRPQQRRPPRGGRVEDALARLAVVDLKVNVEVIKALAIPS